MLKMCYWTLRSEGDITTLSRMTLHHARQKPLTKILLRMRSTTIAMKGFPNRTMID